MHLILCFLFLLLLNPFSCSADTHKLPVLKVSFEGEITEYSNKPLTASSNYQAATNRFTISIKVKFDNSVEPEYSFESSFSRYEDYESSNDFSSVEAELSERIMELLVEDIFNKAFVTW